MNQPLSALEILEVGRNPALGYATRLYAQLGAHVTRVQDASDPPAHEAMDVYLQAHQERVTYGHTGGPGLPAVLRARLPGTHLLFCEPAPAAGCDPSAIAAEFPHLVVVSVTPFGLDAPVEVADDLTLQALGAISIGIGLPDRPPLKLPGNQTAFQAGLSAAIAALGVVISRQGALIDVAAADVWASFYAGVDVALAHFGRHRRTRAGQRAAGQPYPRTIYRCRDGYFAIQCGESRHWRSLLEMIGQAQLADHPFFANRFVANDVHGDACDAFIEPWFRQRTKAEILNECLAHTIPGAPVYDIPEVMSHPHLVERGFFTDVEVAGRRLRLPGPPYADFARGADTGSQAGERPVSGDLNATAVGDKRKPLSGVRVVDFGWVWAGAVPGHVLADLGAEVIKIESAHPLDYMRQGRPIVGTAKDPEQNPMFANVNRGKLSMRIKLDHPAARQVLLDLIAVSDVVIENFSPGVMRKFGLTDEAVRQVRPDIVMCSMSAVGQTGPLRGIRTYATMIAGLAGLDAQVSYPGERVLGSQSSYADPNASLHAVFAILAALWRRQRKGVGASIDLSQWEAAVAVMGEYIVRQGLDPHAPQHSSAAPPSDRAPYGHYPVSGRDEWIAIAVSTDAQWRALGKVLGSPSWMAEGAYSGTAGRIAARERLDEQLRRETRGHAGLVLAYQLRAAGVPAAPLLRAEEIAANEQFVRRRLFEAVEHPILGALPVYRLPWHVDGKPLPITRRAPLLGEHQLHVMKGVLGYSDARVDALAAAGLFD